MSKISRSVCRTVLIATALGFVAPAFAQEPMRVSPDKLSSYWIVLDANVSVDVPNTGLNLNKPGCVAVTYIIGSDGVPRNVQIAKVEPKSGLGPAAVSAVSHFHYGPSLSNKDEKPVSTYYVVPFNSPDDKAAQQQLMAPCQLPGYSGQG